MLPITPAQSQWQTPWASELNPVLENVIVKGLLLEGVPLVAGDNFINHRLGRKLQGWYITRMRSVASAIYDTQDGNPRPALVLQLNASVAVVVDIYVF
jgi:hypothetical protein